MNKRNNREKEKKKAIKLKGLDYAKEIKTTEPKRKLNKGERITRKTRRRRRSRG